MVLPTLTETTTTNGKLHEFVWYDSSPTYELRPLPKSSYAPPWENVVTVIHRCASTYQILFHEHVDNANRSAKYFWKERCHCDEGTISTYLYKGEKMAPLMEERVINDAGKEVLTPNTATSNLMLAEFGRQLELVAKRLAPVYEATHSVLQHKLGGDHIRYMADDDQCSKILNVKFVQLRTRPARLHL